MSAASLGDRVELLYDWPRVRLKAGATGVVTAVNAASVTILWDAHDGDGVGYAEAGGKGGYPDGVVHPGWHMGATVAPITTHRECPKEERRSVG